MCAWSPWASAVLPPPFPYPARPGLRLTTLVVCIFLSLSHSLCVNAVLLQHTYVAVFFKPLESYTRTQRLTVLFSNLFVSMCGASCRPRARPSARQAIALMYMGMYADA
jgi:hypothetical protein